MTAPAFAPILEAARTRLGAGALEASYRSRARRPTKGGNGRPLSVADAAQDLSRRPQAQPCRREMAGFRGGIRNFEPRRVRAMSDEALEALLGDRRLIRHWGKLKSVRDNAAAMIAVAEEHGSFGAWLADWPGTNIVELWEALAKRFSQMGGNSGPSFLRMVGKDTFVLTHSVTAALKRWGAADTPPKNRKDRAAVQSQLQRLGRRNRPAALSAELDPRRLGRGVNSGRRFSLGVARPGRRGGSAFRHCERAQRPRAGSLATKIYGLKLKWIGDGSQLRDPGYQIATLHQLRITLDYLERGILPLAPEADVELVLADAEVIDRQVRRPFRKPRVDIQLVPRRIRQKAQ